MLASMEEKDVPLIVGLLLLHLKFQTESLLNSAVYDKCCRIILETKGSSALALAFMQLIDSELHPKRQACVKAFFRYLWLLQSQKAVTELDSIALATRFGTFILRPPSGQEPTLPRVKLMGALAVLIENFRPASSGSGSGSGKSGRSSPPPSVVESAATPPPMRKDSSGPLNLAAGMTIRAMPSLSVSGVQVGEVARSAIVVLDSSQRGLVKLRENVEKEDDAAKLRELVKRLKHLEQVVNGRDGKLQPSDYSI
jgi:hypothetical protein